MFKKIRLIPILNFLTIIFLLVLPYLVFNGKLFLGGDDTRLFYTYPLEFIKNVSFFSWHNVSSVGINSSDQYILPFMGVWLFLHYLIPSDIVVTYFAFSLPLILGFIFFQKTVNELFNLNNKYNQELLIGSLFYILSPILIINQLFIFLTAICLIGVIPINMYLYLRFLKTNSFKYVILGSLATIFLMGILYTLPWVLGFLLPIFIGLLFGSLLFSRGQNIYFLKKLFLYFGFMAITQSYWLITFVSSYLSVDSNSFAQKFSTQGFVDTFTPTILTTATGNIFYPILNLFHRQIAMDFEWKLLDTFIKFYDFTFVLNSIYILIIAIGLLSYRKYLNKQEVKVFIVFLISFIAALYFFTVNIGPLKDLFLIFGKVPGFLMFRNFYDKFALGYVLIYSIIFTISLVIFRKKYPHKYRLFEIILVVVIFINFIPVKGIVNSPMWRTDSIYRVINIPSEYLNFMAQVEKVVPSTNTALSLPFGTSTYSIIKDEDTENVYVGISPVKIFSGVNDISGHYSFNFSEEANTIDSIILNKNYKEFNKILFKYNINYIVKTNNVPAQVKKSWVFDEAMLAAQDKKFENAIMGKKLITSSNGNYELFETKNQNIFIDSPNLIFKKISPVKYRLYFKNVKKNQILKFNDSYHGEWKLFLEDYKDEQCSIITKSINSTKECKPELKMFHKEDLRYAFSTPVFEQSHEPFNEFANQWKINNQEVQKGKDTGKYKINKDGSINFNLTLYFIPQSYFYYGVLITVFAFIFGILYLVKFASKDEK